MTSSATLPSDRPATIPSWIRAWFALNAFIVLFPPIYWASNAYGSAIEGVPANLFYFAVACVSTTCSVVAAYVSESGRQEHRR